MKNKRLIIIISIALILAVLLTTVAVTIPAEKEIGSISEIKTCSKPQGKIIARGIDVSFYQGNIDFEAVKESGIDFVILRAGSSGLGADENFYTYYSGALSAGLDIGCYYYTYATTVDEAVKDADDLLSIIDGREFTYPVFLDFEEEAVQSAELINSNTYLVDAFCEQIKSGGYYPGVYTSTSIYNNFLDTITLGNTWDFWIASYDDHTSDSDAYHHDFSMWQYSNLGSVSGISGDVDLDVSYVDYPSIIKEFRDKILKFMS